MDQVIERVKDKKVQPVDHPMQDLEVSWYVGFLTTGVGSSLRTYAVYEKAEGFEEAKALMLKQWGDLPASIRVFSQAQINALSDQSDAIKLPMVAKKNWFLRELTLWERLMGKSIPKPTGMEPDMSVERFVVIASQESKTVRLWGVAKTEASALSLVFKKHKSSVA